MLNKIKDALEVLCRASDKLPTERLKDNLVGVIGCAIIGYFVHSICTMRNAVKITKL